MPRRREAAQRRLAAGAARLESVLATFRAALILDIRRHLLAWSVIAAGLIGCAMLWGSILGAPLARPAADEMAAPAVAVPTEHPIEFGPPE